jgi:hypothetical protein
VTGDEGPIPWWEEEKVFELIKAYVGPAPFKPDPDPHPDERARPIRDLRGKKWLKELELLKRVAEKAVERGRYGELARLLRDGHPANRPRHADDPKIRDLLSTKTWRLVARAVEGTLKRKRGAPKKTAEERLEKTATHRAERLAEMIVGYLSWWYPKVTMTAIKERAMAFARKIMEEDGRPIKPRTLRTQLHRSKGDPHRLPKGG